MQDKQVNKGGRPHVYAEPSIRVCINVPKSTWDFVSEYAVGLGLSRSAAVSDILEQLKLESIKSKLQSKESMQ